MLLKPEELVGVHLCTELQQEVGVGLFELSAGLGDTVDLDEQCHLVQGLGVNERVHASLFGLEVLEPLDEQAAIGFEDGVHAALLVGP